MREKLIKLLDEAENFAKEKCAEYEACVGCPYSCKDANYCMGGFIVDHLLANGVIALPCKVGQEVWVADKCRKIVVPTTVEKAMTTSFFVTTHPELKIQNMTIPLVFTGDSFGKTVFLTREAAESALKEGKG